MTTAEPMNRQTSGERQVLDDLVYLRTVMVNLYFVGRRGAGDRQWVLIDAGMSGSAELIAQTAEARFGMGSRPAAIILTHGHFDHVGALDSLSRRWDAPVYAHPMELPYLTGRSSYPPPDPTVGGGLVSALSWSYPRGPIDLGDRVKPLPQDGSVPGMSGWRWIHTPGHTPGHVVLYRDSDRTLVAGDAVVTTKQESILAVMTERRELHGPPMYYTSDWDNAACSVAVIAALGPEIIATGHGEPLQGSSVSADLAALASDFYQRAVPRQGRYVQQPAKADAGGIVSLPPDSSDLLTGLLLQGGTFEFVRRLFGEDVALS